MVDGIWNKETFINCPDKMTQDAMTHDMLSSLNNHMIELCKQPALCNTLMDEKIITERKRRGKISLGLGGGGAAGAVGLWELFKSWMNNP